MMMGLAVVPLPVLSSVPSPVLPSSCWCALACVAVELWPVWPHAWVLDGSETMTTATRKAASLRVVLGLELNHLLRARLVVKRNPDGVVWRPSESSSVRLHCVWD